MSGKYYGKYRGIVTDTQDPLMTGRIRAKVPDLLGEQESGWALPCLPFAGTGMGLFALPAVGASVWIEFEQGDLDYPIWTGCWWGSSKDLPQGAASPPFKKTILMTEGGNSVTLDDTPGSGGITLETSGGQKITLSASGIEIDNGQGGKISISGLQVSINDGGLEVT